MVQNMNHYFSGIYFFVAPWWSFPIWKLEKNSSKLFQFPNWEAPPRRHKKINSPLKKAFIWERV